MVEGEEMFEHFSVLNQETIEGLSIQPNGTYVDCTLGGAGHSKKIIEKLTEKGHLVAFDQDETAIEHARELLSEYENQVTFIHRNFSQLEEALDELDISEVEGIVFDLGVSSPQLDQIERGFSYHNDAPLDMRMNQTQKLSAYEVVNHWTYEQLVKSFFRYGEEKFSKQIARNIERKREEKPIETTLELVEIIKEAIPAPARRKGGHPAKRIFQAIRIAVNDELNVFEEALHQAARKVAIGGRIAVITFHSLEDKICKQAMKKWSTPEDVPKEIPLLPEEIQPPFKLINKKPIVPNENELDENRRSRSAKLRICEKVTEWDEKYALNGKGSKKMSAERLRQYQTLPHRKDQTSHQTEHHAEQAKKTLFTKGEKFLYTLGILVITCFAIYMVMFSTSVNSLNRDIQQLDSNIETIQSQNVSLHAEVQELSNPTRILTIAEKHGLDIKNSNVKQANNTP